MHYTYDVLVLPEHVVSNHLEVTAKLTTGIIKHVSIIFPPGCSRLVHCTIWNPAQQLLPSNPEATYYEDSYAVEVDCNIPTWMFGNEFYILAWNTGTIYRHLIHVMFDVRGVDEPELADSIDTLNNVIESLVSVIKGWF